MKLLSSLFLVFFLTSGCMNEDDLFQKSPDGIVGTWRLVERSYSDGVTLHYQTVEDLYEITFKDDFTFLTHPGTHCENGSYHLDNRFLDMVYNCEGNYEGVSESRLRLEFEGSRMTMIPVNPVCIEGCSSVYRKLKE